MNDNNLKLNSVVLLSRRFVENISNMCSIHIAVNASVSGNRPSDCKERESRLE